jgi:hypothetical protein
VLTTGLEDVMRSARFRDGGLLGNLAAPRSVQQGIFLIRFRSRRLEPIIVASEQGGIL